MTPVALDTVIRTLMAAPPRVVAGDAGWRFAAVAAVFRTAAGPGGAAELLFIRRAQAEGDAWSGQIGFPGGREEPKDATLEDTAIRETREELALDLAGEQDRVVRLGALDEIRARARRPISKLAIRPYAFALNDPEHPTLVPNEEVAAAFWVPLAELTDPARRTTIDRHRSDVPYRFPAVDLGERGVLWGLTLQMVADILGRLGAVEDPVAWMQPEPR